MAVCFYKGVATKLKTADLDDLRTAVQGSIELVPGCTESTQFEAFVNEEGRCDTKFERNYAGEMLLLYLGFDEKTFIKMGLVGPIVVTRKTTPKGNTPPMPEPMQDVMVEMYKYLLACDDPYEDEASVAKLKEMAAALSARKRTKKTRKDGDRSLAAKRKHEKKSSDAQPAPKRHKH